jgi:hypothetical protein
MAKKQNDTFNDFLLELKSKSTPLARKIEEIDERKYFLIVSEGEKTEPIYFEYIKQFLPKKLLETVEIIGEGDNTLNIVKKAILERDKRKVNSLLPNFDEVWAVFDKDDFPSVRYNNAIKLAKSSDIEEGSSNQAFELWYVLHFEFLQSSLHRKDYFKKLSGILGYKYEKNTDKIVKQIFEKGNVKRAIQWAKELEKLHVGKTPANACPSTRVYKLVENLLAYSKKEF